MQTTRGCYWHRCSFCTHYKSAGRTYQQRSIPSVIDELRRHVAKGIRHFALVDDIISPARFTQLSQAIVEAGLKVHYYAMAKPIKQFEKEVLEQMIQSGCRFILWGLESGSQRVLDLMDKGTKLPEIEAVLETAASVGIKNHVFVMCGFPTETKEDFQDTLDLLNRKKASINHVHKAMYVMEKDTPVFDNPDKFSVTRRWPARTVSLFEFECSTGMSRAEATDALKTARATLRSFDSPLPDLPDFRARDHLLLRYSREVETIAEGHEPRGEADSTPIS